MALGLTYKKNSFYIETTSETAFRDEAFLGDRVFKLLTFGALTTDNDLKEVIALDHELNHCVQDLSITACITEGEFRDTIRARLAPITRVKGLRYPLFSPDNQEFNNQLLGADPDINNQYTYTKSLYEIYDYLFVARHQKPDFSEYKYNTAGEVLFQYLDLSVTDLLETYAHHKSFWNQFMIASNSDSMSSKLLEIVRETKLYPYTFDGNSISVDADVLKYSKPYHSVHAMLMAVMPFNLPNLVEYYSNRIPKDYFASPAYIMMRFAMVVLETALCIPGCDYIVSEISKDPRRFFAFSPVHRFYRILKICRDYGGAPDAVDREDYFITFHNWVAGQAGWPSYNDTLITHLKPLYDRATIGKEVLSNYKLTALSDRLENTTKAVYAQPIELFRRLYMPVMIRVNGKLVCLFFLGNHVQNATGLLSFYGHYFTPMNLDMKPGIVYYESLSDDVPQTDKIKRAINNSIGAQREIVVRLLAYEVLQATTKRGYFSCPMAKNGCPNAYEKCCHFTDFYDIIPHCKMKVYRGEKEKVFKSDETGNSVDCMLFDYMLDYGFHPLCLQQQR